MLLMLLLFMLLCFITKAVAAIDDVVHDIAANTSIVVILYAVAVDADVHAVDAVAAVVAALISLGVIFCCICSYCYWYLCVVGALIVAVLPKLLLNLLLAAASAASLVVYVVDDAIALTLAVDVVAEHQRLIISPPLCNFSSFKSKNASELKRRRRPI